MTNPRCCTSGAFLVTLTLSIVACDKQPLGPTRPDPIPSTHGVSGFVTETTDSGVVPLDGVQIKATYFGGSRIGITNTQGRYAIGVPQGDVAIEVVSGGFETLRRNVTVTAATVLDFSMVRKPAHRTLSGYVMEETAAGRVPVADVDMEAVYCPPGPRGSYSLRTATTDADGFYSIPGLCDSSSALFVYKPGYHLPPTPDPQCEGDGAECRWIEIAGNTRFDVLLVRN